LLVFLGISSLGPYGIIISGWASNSSYAILGSLRSIAQFISYEVILTFLLLPIIMYSESLNFIEIVYFQKNFMWFCIPLFPFFIWFIVAVLAETNRTPFDLPEAEAELVAGYNTEYAGVFFIMFMLAEYSNLLCMSALISLLFVGGWDFGFFEILINIFIPEDIVQYLNFFLPELIFAIKITLFVSLFIVIRATLPRFRFDQLMSYCWCHLLPLSFGVLIFTIYIYVLTLNIAFFI
jgi:NADH:ubiquinone oxidoreductase subunit H